MTTAPDRQVRALISAANQAASQGRLPEADRLFREAEACAPRHPLVLNQQALRRLDAADPGGALELLEAAAAAEPTAEICFNLAVTFRLLRRSDQALAALEQCLRLNPGNLLAMLEKGALQDALGQTRAAAMTYRKALQMAPPHLQSASPSLQAAMQRARAAVDANNRELENVIQHRLSDLRREFHGVPLKRFDECVNILLQKRQIPRSEPTFMFFPELPVIEFYERAQFPQLRELEADADAIRAELLQVLADGTKHIDPYIVLPRGEPPGALSELANSRRWGAYFFWKGGREYPEHIARCPRTASALKRWPLWDIPGNGPNAMFSILEPHTRIPPHTGTVNTRLVVHLPLIVPPGCGFRVGGQQRPWTPGEAFVFDDSIDHEAWNDSDLPRAVLIFTIWHPALNEPERALLRELTLSVGDFYGVGEFFERRTSDADRASRCA